MKGSGFLFVLFGQGVDLVILFLIVPGVVGTASTVVVITLIGIRVSGDTIVAAVHTETIQHGLYLHAEHIGVRLNIFFLDHSLTFFTGL